jgi:hypothetical protein
MTKYDFSSRAGFQLAMKHGLSTTHPAELKAYAEAMVVPNFHQVINGKRLTYGEWHESLEAWSSKVIDYNPIV